MIYNINPQTEHILIWHSTKHDHLLTFIRNGRVRTYGHEKFSSIHRTVKRLEDIAKTNNLMSHYYIVGEYNPEHRLVKWSNHYKHMIDY